MISAEVSCNQDMRVGHIGLEVFVILPDCVVELQCNVKHMLSTSLCRLASSQEYNPLAGNKYLANSLYRAYKQKRIIKINMTGQIL